jgi:hypothetical protein
LRTPSLTALTVAAMLLIAGPTVASAQVQLEGGLGVAIPTVDLGNTTKPGPYFNALVGVLATEQITINVQGSGSFFSGKTVFSGGQSAGTESDIKFYTYGLGIDINPTDRFSDWMLLFQVFGGFTSIDVGACAAPCIAPTPGGSETDFTFWGGVAPLYKVSRSVAVGGGIRYYVVFSSGPNLTSLPILAMVRWTLGQ